jgi:DNA repair protein RadD
VVAGYLENVAKEAVYLASQRRKWIAFTPSVVNAECLADNLNSLGITAAVVCGETPKQERQDLIQDFRSGQIHCLVTVLALSVGFDVPDVDCIIWCRPTKSPVLYVQGMGRGTRIADGKENCLVLDFTDTVERLGPVDIIKGRVKRAGGNTEGPYSICPECGERNAAKALICTACGATIREEEAKPVDAKVSLAALLSAQAEAVLVWHDVTRVKYAIHRKEGKPDSMRVDYYSGILQCASEWVCIEHTGYARQKAVSWLNQREANQRAHKWSIDYQSDLVLYAVDTLNSWSMDVEGVLDFIAHHGLKEPTRIATRKNGKYTEVKDYEFN